MPTLPKAPELKQRRNKSTTRAVLSFNDTPQFKPPQLPRFEVINKRSGEYGNRKWQPITKRWWADIWKSPMAAEYLKADIYSLFVLAVLVDDFWINPTPNLAKEIRLQQQAFGLTPLDRRRLEWSVEQAEQAKDKTDRKRRKGAKVIEGDPRELLK